MSAIVPSASLVDSITRLEQIAEKHDLRLSVTRSPAAESLGLSIWRVRVEKGAALVCEAAAVRLREAVNAALANIPSIMKEA